MAEKRLIDASAVLETQFTAGLSDASGNYYGHADVVFASDIENAQTVDAVEVVRCKDCDFRVYDNVCQEYYCNSAYGMCGAIDDNSFCSYGERRTDNETEQSKA